MCRNLRRRNRLEEHRAIIADAQHLVDHRAMGGDQRRDLAAERDLLVAQQTSAFDQDDARVELSRAREPVEVVDVTRMRSS